MDYFSHKIKDIFELSKLLEGLKAQGKKVAHCHGVFDLVHPRHIHYFKQGKDLGNLLVVSIVPDKFANEKGPNRPFFNETERAYWVSAIECVDFVTINPFYYAADAIRVLKPDFYCKGEANRKLADDPTSGVYQDKLAAFEVGAKFCFTEELPIHSTNLFKKILR